jgi:hypothetical protein
MSADASRLLEPLRRACDTLVAAAERHGGLLPSLMSLDGSRMLEELPPAIPGQRDGDRCPGGSNLMHDFPTLEAWRGLSALTGEARYAEAAERYLDAFVARCTDTPTGLFCWGEHAYWDLVHDQPGNSHASRLRNNALTHDHLRKAPTWLWEALWERSPEAVSRFARGLDRHWVSDARDEYLRHAPILAPEDGPGRPAVSPGIGRSCDFPRHSGFYVLDLVFTHARTGEADLLDQARRFGGYWRDKRGGGLLLSESRTPDERAADHRLFTPRQTLSLAVSLLEAADLVQPADQGLADDWRAWSRQWIDVFLALPHDPTTGGLVASLNVGDDGKPAGIRGRQSLWGSKYGQNGTASTDALLCLAASHSVKDHRLIQLAEQVGEAYRTTPMPTDPPDPMPIKDAGTALGLLVELHHVTGESHWLPAAEDLAEQAVAVFLHTPLPRGATGLEHYESQLMPGYLLQALTRLLLTLRDPQQTTMPADTSQR